MAITGKLTGLASAFALLTLTAFGQTVSRTAGDPQSQQPLARPQARQQLQSQRPREVAGLASVGKLPDQTLVDVAIGLSPRNEAARDSLLRDLYNPASPQFHKFLTPKEYTEKFAPTEADYQALLAFAQRNHLTVVATSPNRAHVHVRASAATINAAFHVSLLRYKHPTENRISYAPDREPSVDMGVPLKFIVGLDDFHLPGRIKKQNPNPPHAGGSGSNGAFTGNDFRKAYAPNVALTGAGQTVGILELNGYNASDIAAYEKNNGLPKVPLQNVYLDGYTGAGPNLESAADIELVISMAPGLSKINIYGVPYSNPAILDALAEMANPTQGEPLPYQITTSYYFNYQNGAVYGPLAQLVAQGQALSVASGDFGSYNEISGSGDFPPADDPHVTSVGGTVLTTDTNGAWSAETTWSGSGGGFSPWAGGDPEFKIPSWQVGMNFAAFGGSSTARNAPDVAMVATNISIFFNGASSGFAGTSAASPLWAGFMALANQQAALRGRPRIGFPNPALYSIGRSGACPSCFHDITTGNNFNATNPTKYSAVPGYDLTTGWGTPNGINLINALVDYGYGAPFNRIQHAIVATNNGEVHEIFFNPSIGVHVTQPALATFPGIVGVAGYYKPNDTFQHVIAAANNGEVHEVFFSPSIGIHVTQPALATFPGIVGIAGYYTPNDTFQHVIVATNNGEIHEVFFSPSIGIHVTQPALATFPGIVGIAGYYTPDDTFQHVIVATNNGEIHEVFFSPSIGIHATQPALATFPGIVGIAGYYTPDDRIQHVIVATNNGEVHEVFFSPSIGIHVTQPALATFTGIVGVAGYYTPDSGIQHVIVATKDGQVHEVLFSPSIGIHVTQPALGTFPGVIGVAGYYTP